MEINDINSMEDVDKFLTSSALEQPGGKLVYSEGRTCTKCGKDCSATGDMCVAKGFGVFTCAACEPGPVNSFNELKGALSDKN